ncbi:MAG: single-stranded-DNA-specific exonuclease RecJ [Bacteroidales bacterium]|nr:single-stranded-DNA-specific exonuclease RecJ [Bacteroidales bacterium]
MNFEWIIKKQADLEKIRALSGELNNLDFTLTNLLIQRGVDSFVKAKDFFRVSFEDLHDPFLMKNMQIAVERLEKALDNNEKILVYGDYDVDGTTSVALVYKYLSNFTENISFYVPDRYSEGYGISFKGIDFAKDNDFSLVIALDCGIKAVDKIKYANERNVDFIICDHHTPGEVVPDAIAVLNPKQIDCEYPYKELSGCGVGFKFLQAFTKYKKSDSEKLNELLDLVAVSIASDIVPITGENRILETYGLKQFNNTNNAGFKALKTISGMNDQDFTVSDLVFKIGPRINAAGRMDHANFAVNLLVEDDDNNAQELANQLNTFNENRKTDQDNITVDVLKIFEDKPELLNKKSTVVYDEQWNKGIVGIVASKIIEKYYKPTIVLTKSHGKWTGSARSVENFDLYSAIDSCSHLLHSFGGHKFAAGLTVEDENLNEFIECFEKSVKQTISEDSLTPKLVISDTINLSRVDAQFYKILKQFAPFGPENMKPVFLAFDVVDTGASRQIGKDFSHLKLEIKDKTGAIISGVAFGMGHLYDEIKNKQPFDICFTINENVFNNRVSLQLDIKDIRLRS